MKFISDNIGTIIVALILAGVVAGIVVKFVRDRRKGKSVLCDCGCSGCPSAGACHRKP